eukprot:Sspe_Gene.83606::Locus_54839_Transcript_1_1_Confidence_1.000_Length_2232::g.83606::m.83606
MSEVSPERMGSEEPLEGEIISPPTVPVLSLSQTLDYTLTRTSLHEAFGIHLSKNLTLTQVDPGTPGMKCEGALGHMLTHIQGRPVVSQEAAREIINSALMVTLSFRTGLGSSQGNGVPQEVKGPPPFLPPPVRRRATVVEDDESAVELDLTSPNVPDMRAASFTNGGSSAASSPKGRSTAQIRWDRAIGTTLLRLDSERQRKRERAMMWQERWHFVLHMLWEVMVITVLTGLTSAFLSTPLIVGLQTGRWHETVHKEPGEHVVDVRWQVRTHWGASEWIVLGIMQFSITLCLMPVEAWRWVVAIKLLSLLTVLVWLYNTRIEGWLSDGFFLPAFCISLGGAVLDTLYLLAVKKSKRAFILILALFTPTVCTYILFVAILRPFYRSTPLMQLVYRLIFLPTLNLIVSTLCGTAARQFTHADSAVHTVGMQAATIVCMSTVGRVMIATAKDYAQPLMILGVGMGEFVMRTTVLQRATWIDHFIVTKVLRSTVTPSSEAWFTDAVATENLFEVLLEVAAIFTTAIIVPAGWNARYFFDMGYSIHGNPSNGWLAWVVILQLVIEFLVTISSTIVQRYLKLTNPSIYANISPSTTTTTQNPNNESGKETVEDSTDSTPPSLLEHGVKFVSPRIVLTLVVSFLFCHHFAAATQKTRYLWEGCDRIPFPSVSGGSEVTATITPLPPHLLCAAMERGSLVFPNDGRLYCCSFKGYLKGVHLYYP